MGHESVSACQTGAASRSRASFVPSIHAESQQEQELLDLYRRLSVRDKSAILAALRPLAGTATPSTSLSN
jgi:hypothetical protein